MAGFLLFTPTVGHRRRGNSPGEREVRHQVVLNCAGFMGEHFLLSHPPILPSLALPPPSFLLSSFTHSTCIISPVILRLRQSPGALILSHLHLLAPTGTRSDGRLSCSMWLARLDVRSARRSKAGSSRAFREFPEPTEE
jgi:hypothetical protein